MEDASFEVQNAALGDPGEKMNRINADPLFGLPFEYQSYGAAGTRKFDIKTLKSLKHPRYNNMFVKGFMHENFRIPLKIRCFTSFCPSQPAEKS